MFTENVKTSHIEVIRSGVFFHCIPCHNIEIPQVQMSCLADLASLLGMMDT